MIFYTSWEIIEAQKISHNIPAVYDVLPARIRALRSKDQGWQNVGEGGVGMEHKPRSGLPLLGAPPALLITRVETEPLQRRSIYRPDIRCRNRDGVAASNKCYKNPIRFRGFYGV
jgi:hypothetical protein